MHLHQQKHVVARPLSRSSLMKLLTMSHVTTDHVKRCPRCCWDFFGGRGGGDAASHAKRQLFLLVGPPPATGAGRGY